MPTLDVFRDDAFSVTSLTVAINKVPYKPGRIGALGLFRRRGITTTSVMVEEKDGQLSLIQQSPRGGPASSIGESKRTARAFVVPHFERDSRIVADEVQNVRAFGSESNVAGVQAVVDERLVTLRDMHDVTLEYLEMGAIKGVILDGDGVSTIYNLFTEFGVSQQTAALDLDWDLETKARAQIVEAKRLSEVVLGSGGRITGWRALCGDYFFDSLVEAKAVRETLKAQEGSTLRGDLRAGFQFGGVTWENYSGSVGGVEFIATGEAYLIPEGVPGLFETYFAPADFLEAANTVGLPVYAKIAFDAELNRWVKVHTQSNPLALCTRPRAVIKLTFTT
jgi:hypothetical protein